MRLLDAKSVWVLRNKYAQLRPTGWRSDPAVKVPPRYEEHKNDIRYIGIGVPSTLMGTLPINALVVV